VSDLFHKIADGVGLPPIRLHDLRHTAASLALQAGVPLKVVSEALGHSSLAITADTYTSVLPDVAKAAAEAVAGIIPRAVEPEAPTAAPEPTGAPGPTGGESEDPSEEPDDA
jgi:site-specific recombinase XerD